MSIRWLARLGTLALLLLAIGMLWQATSAESLPAKGTPAPLSPLALTQTLGGPDRYLTHLSTDKPIYRPGESVYVRGAMLHHATRKPLADGAAPLVEIRGPKGDSVASGWSTLADSVLGFSWQVPPTLAGGEYTIHVTHPSSGQPPAERKFEVRTYRAPRLKSQIKFLRDGYGPGDEVVAMLHTERAEGGVPAGAAVTVMARVDGSEVFQGPATIDEQGNCQARFKLPAEVSRGEGTLVLAIEDGGVVESASKTIPILLQTVDLALYPEGGDLIAGVENRVYFEAFTPARSPADLAGTIVDSDNNEVATFRSEHEGRGRFLFTPQAGEAYTLRISEPAGIKTTYPLPAIKITGAVLSSLQEVIAKDASVRLSLAAAKSGTYRLSLRQRDVELATTSVKLRAGQAQELTLDPGKGDGVLTATVFDLDGRPLAERLVFRQPAKRLSVKLHADAKQYVPGGKVKVTIETRDESGEPVSAVVGIAATDDTVLEMIDKRQQAPRLPVMALLEGDVKELADAHVYLDPANPQAPRAIDLLLGTQGWRRFAWIDLAKFAEQHGNAARRAVAMRIVTLQEERDGRFVDEDQPVQEATEELAGVPQEAAVKSPAAPRFDQAVREKKAEASASAPQLPGQEAHNAGAARDALRRSLDRERAINGKRALFAGDLEAAGEPGPRSDFAFVRLYAHQVRSQRQPGERIDFTETLYWNAALTTDDRGQATVEFDLNDSVSSFRLSADAFSRAGGLGTASLQIDSVEPFYLEPKLPLEVTFGDIVRAPISIVNSTSTDLVGSLQLPNAVLLTNRQSKDKFTLSAGSRLRKYITFNVGDQIGETEVILQASAGEYSDRVTRKYTVQPLGFPAQLAHGGLLPADGTVSHDVTIPKTLVAGSLQARVAIHPSPLASMTEALASLIREPSGCFEQTSSTVYPLVMAQQYFLSHQNVDPLLIEKSSQILQTGYDRLRGFESKSGGFEWFGGDPGHDALTAYGLLEFSDMAQVREVDSVLLERTRKWLLDQRDGKGGYLRKTHTLHTWVADPECANSYNTWALLEAGLKDDLATEVKWVRDAAEKTQNTYVVALAANVLLLAGDKEGENHLLDKLAGKQQPDGSLAGATTSVIGSGGDALVIETTALAVSAWLKNPSFSDNVERGIKYLAKSCQGGRYGSTQSTVLALRAIVAYDKSRAKPVAPGSLQLIVDGKNIGDTVTFTPDTTGVIELPGLTSHLTTGDHQVQVNMDGGSPMPYTLTVTYYSLKPNSADACKLHLEVKLRDKKVVEGAATEADVVVVNRSNEAVPTPIAIIGIPGGLEVRHDQLKELVKANKIAAYEVKGREVILYWRSLDKEARVALPLSLIAAVPGTYTGPASRAYLYYTDEFKHWADGVQIEIEPIAERAR